LSYNYTLYISGAERHKNIAEFFDILGIPYGTMSPAEKHSDIFPIMMVVSFCASDPADDFVCSCIKYTGISEWCSNNIAIVSLSDTCPVCEIVKERLDKLGMKYNIFPAAEFPGYSHFPVMLVDGHEDPYTARDLMRLVNALEAKYGKDGIPE